MKRNLLLLGGLVLASLLAIRFVVSLSSFHLFSEGEKVQIVSTLHEEPKIRYGKQQFSVNIQGYEPIYISLGLFPEFHYADTIRINGSIKRKLLESGNVIATLSYPRVQMIERDKTLLEKVRLRIQHQFTQTLSPTSASLLLGIVFGSKENLPESFKLALQREGLMHIIAASGMNVTIIGNLLLPIISIFLRRRVALASCIGSIFFYVLLTGFEPSIIRAAIMASFALVGQILGRQRVGFISLLFAGYIMLFFDPLLYKDVGFQLSFLATSGIMYLKPLCEKLFTLQKSSGIVLTTFKEDITTTLSAQLVTLPLLLITFGEVNLLSFVSNILLLWIVPPLMILGIIAGFAGLIVPLLGKLVLLLSLPLLAYFETVVSLTYPLNLPITLPEGVPTIFICAYYGMLICLIFYKSRNEKTTSHY